MARLNRENICFTIKNYDTNVHKTTNGVSMANTTHQLYLSVPRNICPLKDVYVLLLHNKILKCSLRVVRVWRQLSEVKNLLCINNNKREEDATSIGLSLRLKHLPCLDCGYVKGFIKAKTNDRVSSLRLKHLSCLDCGYMKSFIKAKTNGVNNQPHSIC